MPAHASPPLSHQTISPANRAATPALPALRTRRRHERLKPQLARIILLRKDFDQFKRIGRIIKRKMQH